MSLRAFHLPWFTFGSIRANFCEQSMPTRIHLFSTQPLPPPGECMALFRRFPELTLQASDILSDPIEHRLNRTPFDPPPPNVPDTSLLFIVHAFTFLAHIVDDGRLPLYVAGRGTGELTALFAAGVLDFSTGLRIAERHTHLLQKTTHTHTLESSLIPFLDPLLLSAPRIPVVSLVTNRPHEPGSIKQNLVRQLTQPSQWTPTLHWLLTLPSADLNVIGFDPDLEQEIDSLRNLPGRPNTSNERTSIYPA